MAAIFECCKHCEHSINDPPHDERCTEGCNDDDYRIDLAAGLLDPPECGPDGEAQRVAEDFDQAATDYATTEREAARELPWLGDPDRRDDDDVEFCVEGEDV